MVAQPIIYVAALTFRRPETLSVLLEAWCQLERPSDWDVRFLIVDNDPAQSAQAVVESFAERFDSDQLAYVVESEPGIPSGRNRALDEATARGARLLAFVDDDEYCNSDWLCRLLAHYQHTNAVLTGGPVRLVPRGTPPGRWRQFLTRSLIARNEFLEAWSARRARTGNPLIVATGNWLGDLEWINAMKVRFDPAFAESGGEDSKFFAAVQALGGKLAWCEDAIVYEHLPSDRSSIRYQYMRSRSYGLTRALLRSGSSLDQGLRILAGMCLLVFPILGRASLMVGIHMIGTGAGWFAGLRGARSQLYARDAIAGPGNSG